MHSQGIKKPEPLTAAGRVVLRPVTAGGGTDGAGLFQHGFVPVDQVIVGVRTFLLDFDGLSERIRRAQRARTRRAARGGGRGGGVVFGFCGRK